MLMLGKNYSADFKKDELFEGFARLLSDFEEETEQDATFQEICSELESTMDPAHLDIVLAEFSKFREAQESGTKYNINALAGYVALLVVQHFQSRTMEKDIYTPLSLPSDVAQLLIDDPLAMLPDEYYYRSTPVDIKED
ncbi:MAG: hypothetical protein GY852_03755 [bacterium]|nr:hypothetical protein [bacterium]